MKEVENCSGEEKPGIRAKDNELKVRDKYFEEMHRQGNINGMTYLRKWRPTAQ